MHADPLLQRSMAAPWEAHLDLGVIRNERGSVLARKRHVGPLVVQRALFPEGPDCLHLVVVHPPGGIAGGDSIRLIVDIGCQARALLTTPGATKWYKSSGAEACQRLSFHAAAGAALEWLPQENIVFDGALACLSTEVDLDDGATFIGWEVTCLGRVAAGERYTFGALSQKTEVRVGGQLVWHERANVRGGDPMLSSPAGLAGFPVSATMLFAAPSLDASIVQRLRTIDADATGRWGVTALPKIIVARYLGRSTEAAKDYFTLLWQVARPLLLNQPAVRPRIWST